MLIFASHSSNSGAGSDFDFIQDVSGYWKAIFRGRFFDRFVKFLTEPDAGILPVMARLLVFPSFKSLSLNFIGIHAAIKIKVKGEDVSGIQTCRRNAIDVTVSFIPSLSPVTHQNLAVSRKVKSLELLAAKVSLPLCCKP